MPIHRSAVLSLVAFAFSVLPAAAQDARPVEVTPYVALGSAGVSPIGTTVTFPVAPKLSVENRRGISPRRRPYQCVEFKCQSLVLAASRRPSDALYRRGCWTRTIRRARFLLRWLPIGTERRMAMTVNAGGGLKAPMSSNLAWRTDARWSKSLGKQGSEQFRVAQGISFGTGKR